MKDNLGGATWRLAIFLMVCLLGVFALFAVFGQLRCLDRTARRNDGGRTGGKHDRNGDGRYHAPAQKEWDCD